MNSDRLTSQVPSTLLTACADLESQLRGCARLCMSLSLLCPRDTALPGLPGVACALPVWGSCSSPRLTLPRLSAYWVSSLPTVRCHLPLDDLAWIPLHCTFPTPVKEKLIQPPNSLAQGWVWIKPCEETSNLIWTRVVWGIKIDAKIQPRRLQ